MESKNIQSRNWLGTFNNPTFDTKDFLEVMHKQGKCIYTCGQLERGEQGTPHIQFFVNFDKAQRLSFVRKLNSKAHWEVVKVNNGAHNYCMKEETRLEGPFEFGKKPVQRNNKHDWEEVKQSAMKGEFDKIPAEIYIKHYQNIKRIHQENLVVEDKEECRGVWIYGPPGTGKTTFARTEYEDVYIKAQNKWWDGYKGQKTVVLDDLDSDCLHHYLKIWADKWSATGEIKGGTVALKYDHFIVTSNYSIDELFKDKDDQIKGAIKRRFREVYMGKDEENKENEPPIIHNRRDEHSILM